MHSGMAFVNQDLSGTIGIWTSGGDPGESPAQKFDAVRPVVTIALCACKCV